MKLLLCWIVLISAVLTGCDARHLRLRRSMDEAENSAAIVADRQGLLPAAAVAENAPPAPAQGDSNGDPAEVRGPFDDFVPYVSSFVYRDAVKRWIINPMIKGSKYIMPSRAVTYYRTRLAHRRFFRVISPLYPALSSYTNKKFEQGVFWTLRRGYTLVRDNFFEFESGDDDEKK